jgi:hypothetical protein
MTKLPWLLALNLSVAMTLTAGRSMGQERRVYQHPTLNVQFQATPNWERVPRPEDALIYEVADPTGVVHVVLWYTTTEQDGRRYLMKMASMKDVQLEEGQEASRRRIDGHEAWVLNLPGREREARVRTLLAVIPHGKSAERPRENALYVVQIWCPEDEYENHRRALENILASVEITERDQQPDSLPTLQMVLDRYVEAVGGRDAIAKLNTRVIEGRLVTDLPTRQPPVHESNGFWIYAKSPGKYLVIQQSAFGTRREGHDGEVCWSWAGGEVALDAHYDRRFAWLLDPQSALRLREYFPEMRVMGIAKLDGRRAYRVEFDDDRSHDLFFDVETGVLVRLGYNRELRYYREMDGVLVPSRMALSRKGGSSTYIFEKIEHNIPIEDAVFEAPVR